MKAETPKGTASKTRMPAYANSLRAESTDRNFEGWVIYWDNIKGEDRMPTSRHERAIRDELANTEKMIERLKADKHELDKQISSMHTQKVMLERLLDAPAVPEGEPDPDYIPVADDPGDSRTLYIEQNTGCLATSFRPGAGSARDSDRSRRW